MMRIWPWKRLLKYGMITGTILGTSVSLKANQYNVDAIGIVRLGRAAFTVYGIGLNYKRNLYSKNLDPKSEEFLKLKSKVHKESAERLLELCRANKGVYIKVGQHIGALEYLIPHEYVDTMKILHSHAPSSSIEEIYRVLQEDLNKNVTWYTLFIKKQKKTFLFKIVLFIYKLHLR
uniref:ABC1 atypical kinase-like domain-containing protein n=1 Tax=Clastoptera arizonana TaxID=38151 RepID=A0A1B6EB05_9HEMI